MKKSLLATATVLALGAAAMALPANAAIIDWTLENVRFDDGGTASGTFSTDSTSGNVTAFDITTTAGSTLGAAVYDSTTSFLFANNYFISNSFVITTNNSSLSPYIELAFTNPLTSPVNDPLVNTGFTAGSWECNDCSPSRFTVSGEAVVPEPASMALLGAGVAGLGLIRRRRG